MSVNEAAVLAAAKVLYADTISNHAGDNAPQIIAACEVVARKALEAAAPYLMAQAWDECEAAKYEIRLDPTSRFWEPYKINPYRKERK